MPSAELGLSVHGSRIAEPAFAAIGFLVVERRVVQIGGHDLKRAPMEKQLSPERPCEARYFLLHGFS